jgi:hypothetical protein
VDVTNKHGRDCAPIVASVNAPRAVGDSATGARRVRRESQFRFDVASTVPVRSSSRIFPSSAIQKGTLLAVALADATSMMAPNVPA